MLPNVAQKAVLHYKAQIFKSSVKISTDTERSKGIYDAPTFKFTAFVFEEQMSRIYDYHGEEEFPVEGLSKNKVEFRRK